MALSLPYMPKTQGTYSQKPEYQVLRWVHTQFSPVHLPSGIQAKEACVDMGYVHQEGHLPGTLRTLP